MLRSLWSGVSGLKTHQLEMDVIGNNIANVNTTAYKSQATGFSDILYQTVREGAAAGQNTGSTNTAQVGLGARVSSINTNIASQGSAITTNNVLDMMITGDSFFVISTDISTANLSYGRDGSFSIDEDGYLVTQNDGYYVIGAIESKIDDGGALGAMQLVKREYKDLDGDGVDEYNDYVPGEATTQAYMKGNIDSQDEGLKDGRNIALDVYGSDGEIYSLRFTLTDRGDTEDNTFRLTLSSVLDKDGNRLSSDNYPSFDLEYDKSDGKLIGIDGGTQKSFNLTLSGEAAAVSMDVDMKYTTNYKALNEHFSTINAHKGNEKGENQGYGVGVLNGLSVGKDGTIYGEYSNGQSKLKGQVAVAVFNNAMGLEKVGDNLYAASLNSGVPVIQDVTADGGYIQSGVLEGSNVDLAKEFTDMITTQRGFQANSKVITTSDEMLQILKGLKR